MAPHVTPSGKPAVSESCRGQWPVSRWCSSAHARISWIVIIRRGFRTRRRARGFPGPRPRLAHLPCSLVACLEDMFRASPLVAVPSHIGPGRQSANVKHSTLPGLFGFYCQRLEPPGTPSVMNLRSYGWLRLLNRRAVNPDRGKISVKNPT